MRVAIASRIFEPEPSAASGRLSALASAFADAGHEVTVLTVRAPRNLQDGGHSGVDRKYRVNRFPVLRDKSGYVRGYLQYLSFDIPLFLRVLFGARRDLIVVEPPPTTGFFIRIAAGLRRTPYAYYAADIWADASAQTGAPRWMVSAVRRIELFALRGAKTILSVSDGVTHRLGELGVSRGITTIGNGIGVSFFGSDGAATGADEPTFVYAGTASEWHGAEVFVDAFAIVLNKIPTARLRFIGGGSEREKLISSCRQLGIDSSVSFSEPMPPTDLAEALRGAIVSLASVRQGAGYDFAFPTKLYSSAACGTPLLYVGTGPGAEFVSTEVDGLPIGVAIEPNSALVATSMIEFVIDPVGAERREAVAAWAYDAVSISAPAAAAVRYLGLIEQESRS